MKRSVLIAGVASLMALYGAAAMAQNAATVTKGDTRVEVTNSGKAIINNGANGNGNGANVNIGDVIGGGDCDIGYEEDANGDCVPLS
jgi:hypothetical protein